METTNGDGESADKDGKTEEQVLAAPEESDEARAERLRAQVMSMYDSDGTGGADSSNDVENESLSAEAKAWNTDPMSSLQPIIKNKSVGG